jgi:hypothetical protein
MKTVRFSEDEVSLLRNLYSDELDQAERYVKQIKDFLKKLGTPAKISIEVPIEKKSKVAKKRGRKPKAKTIEPKVPKKRGRKSKAVVPTTIEAALIPTPKEIKKVAKKKVTKKRKPKGISLVNLRKPLPKKEPVIESEPKLELVPVVEPVITTTEEPKE